MNSKKRMGNLCITGIGTAVPDHDADQSQFAASTELRCATGAVQREKVRRIFAGTTVRRRGSVMIGHGAGTNGDDRLRDAYPLTNGEGHGHDADVPFAGPTITERMAWYERRALPLAEHAARQAMDEAGVTAAQVTQLVVVSCTGFAAPGLDVRLIDTLGLGRDVGRTMVGFMGCHGALNGLRVADAMAARSPDAVVLVACVELCTVHFQYGYDAQQIVANALFADGAAALVGIPEASANDDASRPRLIDQASIIIPESADAMTWHIRDHGFRMTLSPRVPRLVEANLCAFLTPWLAGHGLTSADVAGWVVHPGGPKVISAVEAAMSLPADAGDASRAILAEHGNMSSPTVLFILRRLMAQGVRGPVVMLAFGPGLVVEAALIELPSSDEG